MRPNAQAVEFRKSHCSCWLLRGHGSRCLIGRFCLALTIVRISLYSISCWLRKILSVSIRGCHGRVGRSLGVILTACNPLRIELNEDGQAMDKPPADDGSPNCRRCLRPTAVPNSSSSGRVDKPRRVRPRAYAPRCESPLQETVSRVRVCHPHPSTRYATLSVAGPKMLPLTRRLRFDGRNADTLSDA